MLYKERQAKLSADVDKLLISECALYLRNLSKDIFEYMEGFSRFLSNRLFGARLGEEGDDWKWLKIQEKTTESAL
ncbi:hypothetical protein P9212_13625 [Geobacillus stearothermophilus]|nr:hypothetical protein [Geobacillus stearothermophilus]